MKTIKAKVIMLPTNDKPTKGSILLRHLWKDTKLECRSVWQYNETKQLSDTVAVYTTLNGSFMDTPSSFKSQHVYLTTDEEIKEGDWFISNRDIYQYEGDKIPEILKLGYRKIVATTDTSLLEHDDTVPYPKTRPALPQIPQEFLKEYCEAGGKIEEVEIKYEEINQRCAIHCLSKEECKTCDLFSPGEVKIKVDSNNCVIIHKSKDSWIDVVMKGMIIDWLDGRHLQFETFEEAEEEYSRLLGERNGEESDLMLLRIEKEFNNID